MIIRFFPITPTGSEFPSSAPTLQARRVVVGCAREEECHPTSLYSLQNGIQCQVQGPPGAARNRARGKSTALLPGEIGMT